MLQGRKVAFFEVGDLSEHQIMLRFMIRAAKTPARPRTVKIPTNLILNGDGEPELTVEEKEFKKGLNFDDAWKACQRIVKKKYGDNGPLLRLSVHPNSSISIHGISAILDSWERKEWVPDVILIDYADILEPPHGYRESRDEINATWKAMRAMSQSRHCLVVTATQAKASAYGAEILGKQDFSEDKRKHAHVTGMVGLNQKDGEKKLGLMRYNWIDLREEEYFENDCCFVASCLSLANPAVLSVM